jgi:hypothetical protein
MRDGDGNDTSMNEIHSASAPELCTMELVPADHMRIAVAEWETLCAAVRVEVEADGLDRSLVDDVVKEIVFVDDQERRVAYDGATWWTWIGTSWAAGRPEGRLQPQRIVMALHVPPSEDGPTDDPVARTNEDGEMASEAFVATDVVPPDGLRSVDGVELDAGLEVMVTEWRSDGWAHVCCSNGWTAWVDGRRFTSE